MICARGKGKRNLRLVARDAARRFTLRRDRKTSADGWLPLVLRWKQRRAGRRDVSNRRGPTRVQQVFFPQTYFQFVTHVGGTDRVRMSPGRFPAATFYRNTVERSWTNQTRLYATLRNELVHRQSSPAAFVQFSVRRAHVVSDRNPINFVTIDRGPQARREYRPSPVNYFISQPLPQRFSERTIRLDSSRIVKPAAGTIRKTATPQISAVTRLKTRRDELVHTFKTHSHTREYQPVTLALHAPSQDTLASAGPTPGKAALVQFDRADELVWRRTQPQSRKDEIVGRSIVAATSQPNPVSGVVEETVAPGASPAISQTAPPPVTKLDPGLIDRLTNDVIRRIEKQARIERQRRGL